MAVIVFDYDGVIADSLEQIIQTMNDVLADRRIEARVSKELVDSLKKVTQSEVFRYLGITEQLVPQLVFESDFRMDQLKDQQQFFPEIVNLIKRLRREHCKYVVSSNSESVIQRGLELFKLREEFLGLFGWQTSKEKTEKFIKVAEIEKTSPTKLVTIGDMVTDIRAAKEVGAVSIAVGWGHQSLTKLQKEEPDFCVESAQELVQLLDTIQ